MRPFLVLLLVGLGSGCARAAKAPLRFAQGEVEVCRHCNCYMPADVDPQSACSVCNCKYPAWKCFRGK